MWAHLGEDKARNDEVRGWAIAEVLRDEARVLRQPQLCMRRLPAPHDDHICHVVCQKSALSETFSCKFRADILLLPAPRSGRFGAEDGPKLHLNLKASYSDTWPQ